MIYSELIKKACNIAYAAHKEDVDKGGYPYVFHPFFLATQMGGEYSTCVALLHDVIEDHGDAYSLDYLKEQGFPDEILHSLKLLTHAKGTPYMNYIYTLSSDAIARKVKRADLKHNLDFTRTNGVIPRKQKLYLQALEYLEKEEESYNARKRVRK